MKNKSGKNRINELNWRVAPAKQKRTKRVGLIRRTINCLKGLSIIKKELCSRSYITAESEVRCYKEVFYNAFKPQCDAFCVAREVFWDYLCKLFRDFCALFVLLYRLLRIIFFFLGKAYFWLSDRVWDIAFYIDQRRRKIFMIFASCVSAAVIVLIAVSSATAYEYSYYGKVLGTVKSKEEVYRTIDVLGDKLSSVTGANINIDVERDIVFVKKYGFNIETDSSDEILNTLTYMKGIQATGYQIEIDGNPAVILQSQEVAENLLQDYKNKFAGEREGIEYKQISIKEDVQITEVQVLLADIWNPEDALTYLTNGSLEPISESNPARPMITVSSVELATYEQAVSFGKDYVENESIYSGLTELVSNGTNGVEKVYALIERINGVEQARVVQETEIVKNPINAVYYIGTMPIPEKKGTGSFIIPVNISKNSLIITTYFDERYTVFGSTTVHKAVDFGVGYGTSVYASDGGVVEIAGYSSTYGFYILIDHGGLYETLYAHLSQLLVKAGDEVYQGQNIALSGSSGVSTGAHLHFEMRYNGERINPLPHIGY